MSDDDLKLIRLNDKMDTVVQVVQDFGLSFIQNIGSLKHDLQILTDQVETLNKTMIDIKGLGVQIEEINKRNESYQEEIKTIKSLIKSIKMAGKPTTEVKVSAGAKNDANSEKLIEDFAEKIPNFTKLDDLVNDLEKLKEEIFKITGGHRILFEINKEIQNLKKAEVIEDVQLDNLQEKAKFWMNKIAQ